METAAFDGFRGSSIIVPEGVTTIGERAFEGSSTLTHIYLPSTLTTLGNNVFQGRSVAATTLSYCGTTPAVQNYASYPGGAHPSGCFVGATYMANDGTQNSVVEANTKGASGSVRTNTFTKSGFDFTGWTAAQNGTGTVFASGEARLFNAHETFYAQWAVSPKTVTFNGNGATSGTMANQSATSSVRLTANGYSKSGYSFAGWNTVQSGLNGIAYADQAFFSFLASGTLYAQWTLVPVPPAPAPEPAKYTVTFDPGPGLPVVTQVVEEKKTVAPPTNPTREGYTFDGWKVSSVGELIYDFSKMLITSPVTISAVWVPNSYSVTFKNGKSTVVKSALFGDKLTLFNKPTKAGFKFAGWKIVKPTAKAFRFSYIIKKDLTIVASWQNLGHK